MLPPSLLCCPLVHGHRALQLKVSRRLSRSLKPCCFPSAWSLVSRTPTLAARCLGSILDDAPPTRSEHARHGAGGRAQEAALRHRRCLPPLLDVEQAGGRIYGWSDGAVDDETPRYEVKHQHQLLHRSSTPALTPRPRPPTSSTRPPPGNGTATGLPVLALYIANSDVTSLQTNHTRSSPCPVLRLLRSTLEQRPLLLHSLAHASHLLRA